MITNPKHIANSLPQGFSISLKRPGVYQLFAPFYHEDGDMYDIFLKENKNGLITITDEGLTLMRVSYVYDFDTPNKEKILYRILESNNILLKNGKITLETESRYLLPSILQFTQVISKITNARLFQREVVQNLFFEELDQYINTTLLNFHPQKEVTPLAGHDEYQVDYIFNHRQRPIYLFGINNPSNARLTTISCLKFLQEGLNFRSLIVFESLDVINKKDLARVMSVADKEYPSLNDFKTNALSFFDRESLQN